MDLEGTYTFQASPTMVWHALEEALTSQRYLPGLERLDKTHENGYAFTLRLKHNPLQGVYTAQVNIIEQQFPSYCRLHITQDGQNNTMSGEGIIHFNQSETSTVVTYKGHLSLDTGDTQTPTTLTKGAAKLIIQQLFGGLADQLRAQQRQEPAIIEQAGGKIIILPATQEQPVQLASSPLTTLARLLVERSGLGAHDPVKQERWVLRVRRLSIISGLLLLVWLGTRLPRR